MAGLCLLAAASVPRAQQAVSPGIFVGTWVGVQQWLIDPLPPGAEEPQPVTLTIELVDGRLVGTLTPFFGGADGAGFVDAQIVGDHLRASGGMGTPRRTADGATFTRNLREGWKQSVKILFDLKADKTELTGTADVLMGEVKWMRLGYELSRKRSRY
ncbi:MAG: hypothetical protein HY701_04095 [Gemmatimonadetes bacterium]|nr:hypothetical protein [Gemmatimonadota bacterium]